MQNKIKLVIADDHPLFRMGVKSLLSEINIISEIFEAQNGQIAIELIKKNNPEIAILDIDMPEKNGVEVAEYVYTENLNTKIIFLTSHSDLQLFNKAMELNVKGFLFKESALDELKDCIEVINSGDKYFSPLCQSFIIENKDQINKLKEIENKLKLLTSSELKILRLIANHLTTKEIAEQLHNSYKTIENHRFNICQKLDIKGTNNLLSFALENKSLIEDKKGL